MYTDMCLRTRLHLHTYIRTVRHGKRLKLSLKLSRSGSGRLDSLRAASVSCAQVCCSDICIGRRGRQTLLRSLRQGVLPLRGRNRQVKSGSTLQPPWSHPGVEGAKGQGAPAVAACQRDPSMRPKHHAKRSAAKCAHHLRARGNVMREAVQHSIGPGASPQQVGAASLQSRSGQWAGVAGKLEQQRHEKAKPNLPVLKLSDGLQQRVGAHAVPRNPRHRWGPRGARSCVAPCWSHPDGGERRESELQTLQPLSGLPQQIHTSPCCGARRRTRARAAATAPTSPAMTPSST